MIKSFHLKRQMPAKKACNFMSKQRGFSLVEMLMALLVASLLLAALAPVMTKKMDEAAINVSGVNNKKLAGTPCTQADLLAGECKVPPEAGHINVILVSGGGGGGGAVRAVEGANIALNTSGVNGTNAGTKRYVGAVLPGTKNLVFEIMSAGGGGGGGGGFSVAGAPKKKSDCEPFGVFVSAAQNGTTNGVCVSKYNPTRNGDTNLSAPSMAAGGITPVSTGVNCTGGSCCWEGQTANPCEEPSSCSGLTGCTVKSTFGQEYGGCRRSVCQWNAANSICSKWAPLATSAVNAQNGANFKGRLPSQAELTKWASYVGNGGALQKLDKNSEDYKNGWRGMQLCDHTAGYGTLRCSSGPSLCPGASGGYCWPYAVWSGAPRETGYYSGFHFVSGSLTMSGACEGTGKCSYTNAFTVRCVLVLNYYKARYRSANELSESSVFTHRTNLKTSSAMNSPVMAPCGAVQQLATARALLLVPMMLTTATRSTYGLHSQAAIRTL